MPQTTIESVRMRRWHKCAFWRLWRAAHDSRHTDMRSVWSWMLLTGSPGGISVLFEGHNGRTHFPTPHHTSQLFILVKSGWQNKTAKLQTNQGCDLMVGLWMSWWSVLRSNIKIWILEQEKSKRTKTHFQESWCDPQEYEGHCLNLEKSTKERSIECSTKGKKNNHVWGDSSAFLPSKENKTRFSRGDSFRATMIKTT